jgi:hypothetical protein
LVTGSHFKFSHFQFRLGILKRNLLGCFLAKDLPHVRTSASVFKHARKVVFTWEEGKFTPEEDEIIVREVKKTGENFETWKRLASLLNRLHFQTLKNRYLYNLKNPDFRLGKWTTHDDSIFLKHFFADKKDSDPEFIESISYSDLQPLSGKLNRSLTNVSTHWMTYVKPILLSYHYECLFTNFKPKFYSYLMKKKVTAFQDIDWDEVKRMFPSQTPGFLKYGLHSDMTSFDTKHSFQAGSPMHFKIESMRPEWKDAQLSTGVKKHRLQIVELYDQIRGISE